MPRSRSKLFPSADDAETAFYEAFERGDLASMMAVWAESDDIVCIHPQGPRLTGFEAVRESWMRIFAGGARLRVRTTEARGFGGQTIAVHAVIELVAAPEENAPVTQVFATNVYGDERRFAPGRIVDALHDCSVGGRLDGLGVALGRHVAQLDR